MKAVNLEGGQSLFEVVVAVGVFALITAAIVGLATSSIRNTTFSKNNALATRYSQEAVEWLRTQRDTDWLAFRAHASATPPRYCLGDLSWINIDSCDPLNENEAIPETVLFREVSFSNVPETVVTATVKTFWTDSQGTHQVEVSTVFTDWRTQ
jgi:type II secretory pathway pseudopilin PulG